MLYTSALASPVPEKLQASKRVPCMKEIHSSAVGMFLKNQHSLKMSPINYNSSVDYKEKQFPIQDCLNPV